MKEKEIIVKEWRDDIGIIHRVDTGENITRCNDCKKLYDCRNDAWQTEVIKRGYIGWCGRTSRPGDVDYVKINDFCSFGEIENND